MRRLKPKPQKPDATLTKIVPNMYFGRGFAAYDLCRVGVPKTLQGDDAVRVAEAAGIITATGKLAKRYR